MIRRLWNLIKGFFARFLKHAEEANPDALLELEVINLQRQISRYNQGLISHAALCERLMAQIKALEQEQTELHAKIAVNLKAENREAAGQYALRLTMVEKELEENRAQSVYAEATYKDLVKGRDNSVGIAKAKIESLRAGINDMKMRQAVAELSEMAAGMTADIGGSGDTLGRLTKMVEDQRIHAAGRARVAKDDLNATGMDSKVREETRSAMAAQALADYEARVKDTRRDRG